MAFTFVITDESINSYGTRILSDGIDATDFLKNPIGLWNHFRNWKGTKDEVLPICRWENLRKEGKKWLADAVFDEKDEFAQKIKSKVEQGIISTVSIGVRIITVSEDKSVLVKGQTRPTITHCMLREISIVDIPANKNACKLYDVSGDEINLNEGDPSDVLPILDTKNMDLKEFVIQEMSLKDSSDDAMKTALRNVIANAGKVTQLETTNQELNDTVTDLTGKLKTYQDAEAEAEKQKCVDLVDQAVVDKKITENQKPQYQSLAEKDYDTTKAILDGMQGAKKPGTGGEFSEGESAWDKRMKEINARK
ncbi:MAG: HK97 family phage prohead protease [Marinilabiliaceae bacterium]|nr:HK97 family phage prohead protease [Marinilabiliaceae bacterium]